MNLNDWREDYNKYSIDEESIAPLPFDYFKLWFDQAVIDLNPEPTAFILSTSIDNLPQSRVVLLKEVEEETFVFYTNYLSKKGTDIAMNPNVSMLFFYPNSQRQIRIHGAAHKLSRDKAISYFDTRPEESRISAIASPQSKIISKTELIQRAEDIRKSDRLDCPEHWGGYAIVPTYFEFWQGQPARLHDRIVYEKMADNSWKRYRLAP